MAGLARVGLSIRRNETKRNDTRKKVNDPRCGNWTDALFDWLLCLTVSTHPHTHIRIVADVGADEQQPTELSNGPWGTRCQLNRKSIDTHRLDIESYGHRSKGESAFAFPQKGKMKAPFGVKINPNQKCNAEWAMGTPWANGRPPASARPALMFPQRMKKSINPSIPR